MMVMLNSGYVGVFIWVYGVGIIFMLLLVVGVFNGVMIIIGVLVIVIIKGNVLENINS